MEELCSCDTSGPVEVKVVNQESIAESLVKAAAGAVIVALTQRMVVKGFEIMAERKRQKRLAEKQNPEPQK